MPMLVMKFGGTSVGSAERFNDVFALVLQARKKDASGVVVVLSAMSGVTNGLIDAANKALARDLPGALQNLDAIEKKHTDTISALLPSADHESIRVALVEEIKGILDELKILLKGISYLGELTKRSLDAVSGIGELLSSKVFAAYAQSKGMQAAWINAREFMITDDEFGRANPLWDEITSLARAKVLPYLKNAGVLVTQGFIGATKDGAFTTLGRGGSDYSAAIIGVALQSDEIQIWTDVDGMLTADPRVVPEAKVIDEVSFQEASELAYFGAKVLHPLTIKPAVEKNIPVKILNTMRPDRPGTLIRSMTEQGATTGNGTAAICAIASKKNITAVFISSPKMLMAHGFLARVFAVFDRYRTPIDLIATSEVSVSLTTDRQDELGEIKEALAEYGDVKIQPGVAIVTVVGRQFRDQSGIAGQVFDALRNINIIMISGGASDINLSFVVYNEDADRAVQQLHKAFF